MPETKLWTPSSGVDPLMDALGLLAWNGDPKMTGNTGAATSQTIIAIPIPTKAGVTYTGVRLVVGVAGTSTAPTGFFVGLATNAAIGSTGAMLAQSNNLNSSASLTTTGSQPFAFNATFTETVTGFRVVTILQNGAFAGTNCQFTRYTPGGQYGTASGAQALAYTAGAAQTALPSNGSNLPAAYSNQNTLVYFVSLY